MTLDSIQEFNDDSLLFSGGFGFAQDFGGQDLSNRFCAGRALLLRSKCGNQQRSAFLIRYKFQSCFHRFPFGNKGVYIAFSIDECL